MENKYCIDMLLGGELCEIGRVGGNSKRMEFYIHCIHNVHFVLRMKGFLF